MAYLTPNELNTHLHGEIMDAVQREDDSIMQAAIDAAISEMRGYLSYYDVAAILATTGKSREPILLLYTKDIAVWHFINLANPNIEMELRQIRYDRAITWLRDVQKGVVVPNLPVPVTTDETAQIGKIKFGSNTKRNTHY
jgi:phage gp36-like protein